MTVMGRRRCTSLRGEAFGLVVGSLIAVAVAQANRSKNPNPEG